MTNKVDFGFLKVKAPGFFHQTIICVLHNCKLWWQSHLAARKQFSKGYISLLCWIRWIYRRNRRNAYSLELSDKFWVQLNKRIQNLTVSNFVGCRRTFCLCHLKWKANAIDRLCMQGPVTMLKQKEAEFSGFYKKLLWLTCQNN